MTPWLMISHAIVLPSLVAHVALCALAFARKGGAAWFWFRALVVADLCRTAGWWSLLLTHPERYAAPPPQYVVTLLSQAATLVALWGIAWGMQRGHARGPE